MRVYQNGEILPKQRSPERAVKNFCCARVPTTPFVVHPASRAKGANSMASQVGTDLAKPYEPNADERAAVVAHLARRKQKPPSPRIKLSGNGKVCGVSADHPLPSLGQALAMHAIGVTDPVLFDGLLASVGKRRDTRRDAR